MLNQIDVEIGVKIRDRRRFLDLSQESLSESLGVTRIELLSFENGSLRIGARLLQKLCTELKVTPAYFLAAPAACPVDGNDDREHLLADAATLNQAFLGLDNPEVRKLIIDLTVSLSKNCQRRAIGSPHAEQADKTCSATMDASSAKENIVILQRFRLASQARS